MVSSNHSFRCSGAASSTPQRRMWENSSSRACSKGVGVETFLGSERFFAMREVLLSFGRGAGSERRRNVTADPARRKGGRPSLASRGGGAASSFRGVTAGRRREFPDGEGTSEGGSMSDDKDQVYGPERAERLVALLRALAERIQELDRAGRLLEAAPELQKLFGNARSELFHYEVRQTYDTPEIAENRRIVEEAERRFHDLDLDEPGDDDLPWRKDPDV